ncbi:GrpB family protein [Streptomyces sp. VRA16 Mangrove soil]|uniref:GrpB family protein n=1 Tax=Streptomyces sp. VRA16 Mangrove soil TaxID=2817434 RepID=UPI001A9FEB4A|nr:GrpB family protein [Streptomyces sp. VRA16 Mangrove soil]MBO1331716.1 GrpB family protein [Streptomyces sp. VRA16 Mangrove soil]
MPFPDESARPWQIVPHQPAWSAEFERLATLLHATLGALAVAVDHVGSTSVPGLAAKDVIDVQVRVASLADAEEQITTRMTGIGFRLRPEPWNHREVSRGRTCRKLVFAPPVGGRPANVHVREQGGPNARYALLFRDYLRATPEARAAWGAFKRRLAEDVPDLSAYGQIKAPATDVLMGAAELWAEANRWKP